ncbi:hypothetical protein [Yersinia hibernica]|uniref:hypothetical protein n=1 Tax=Yersinia hibernica TaxID=2339259 RepID=UPI001FE58EE8|nr:hypothetical protein [Yersinia hibernica]
MSLTRGLAGIRISTSEEEVLLLAHPAVSNDSVSHASLCPGCRVSCAINVHRENIPNKRRIF